LVLLSVLQNILFLSDNSLVIVVKFDRWCVYLVDWCIITRLDIRRARRSFCLCNLVYNIVVLGIG